MSDIRDLSSWNKVTRGYYRFVIAAKACYEIFITYNDGEVTRGILYITGDWISENNDKFFSRELLCEGTLKQCLETAKSDYEQ